MKRFFLLTYIALSVISVQAQQPILSDTDIVGHLTATDQLLTPGNIGAGGTVNATSGLTIGADISLYRNSADVARLADSFVVDGTMSLGTTTQFTPFYINSQNDLGAGVMAIKSHLTTGHTSMVTRNDVNIDGYFGIWNSDSTYHGATFITGSKGIQLWPAASLIMYVTNVSPHVIIDGDIQFDSYQITPSFREKDGAKWKKDLTDAVTGKVYKDDEPIPVPAIPDIYSFTWSKEAQMKEASSFLPDMDDAGKVIKTSEQKAEEFNSALVDIPNRIGVVVEGIDPKYLQQKPDGTVSIKMQDILLAKNADLEKRVLQLEAIVAQLAGGK